MFRWLVVIGAGALLALTGALFLRGAFADSAGGHSRLRWAKVANEACWQMQNRISVHDWAYWQPLNVWPPRRLSRIAELRQELLVIHRAGLAEIRRRAPASRLVERRAVASYERMLAAIRAVVRAAADGRLKPYTDADVRMVLAIQATRAAFAAAGTANICNFAI